MYISKMNIKTTCIILVILLIFTGCWRVENTINDIGNIKEESKTLTQVKEKVVIQKVEESPKFNLEVAIDNKFIGYWEVLSEIDSNLSDIDISMNVYSFEYQTSPFNQEYNGIDYSMWYGETILSKEHSNSDLNFWKDMPLKLDTNWALKNNFVLFHDSVKNKNFTQAELNTLKESPNFKDGKIYNHWMAKNVFSKEKKVKIEYVIYKSDIEKNSIDYDNVSVPEICKKSSNQISCSAEVTYN